MAINIDLVADVKDVIRGTDKIGDALTDVADDLKDVGKAGEKVEDKVSDAFKTMGKEADTAGDKIDGKVSDAFRGLGKDAKTSGDKIGKSVKAGTDEAGEGLDNLKSESASTAAESAASFDGSAESIIGSFQEIAANAFSGFGPAGAAAGLAMAVGVGMAVTALQEGAEKAAAMKEKAVDMVDKIAEAGGDLTKMDLSDTIKEWGREVLEDNWVTVWADESSTKFQQTAQDAKDFGVSSRDAIRAAAGSAADSRKFLDATADDWQRLTKEIARGTDTTNDGLQVQDASAQASLKQRNALSDLRGQAEDNIKTTADAVDIYEIETDALDGLTDAMTSAVIKRRDASEAKEKAAAEEADLRKYVDGTAEAYRAAAEASEASTSEQADLAQYVDGTTESFKRNTAAAEENADALKGSITTELDYLDGVDALNAKLKDNGATVDINTAKGRDNQRAIVDQASAIEEMAKAAVEGGKSTGEVTAKFAAQKDALINQVMPAFGGSKEAARQYIEQILKTPAAVATKAEVTGIAEAEAKLRAFINQPREIPMHISPNGQAVENYITGMTGRKIYVDIAPRNGVGITN